MLARTRQTRRIREFHKHFVFRKIIEIGKCKKGKLIEKGISAENLNCLHKSKKVTMIELRVECQIRKYFYFLDQICFSLFHFFTLILDFDIP